MSAAPPTGKRKKIVQAPGGSLENGTLTLADGTQVDASDIILIDSSKIPIPGLVLLDAEGNVLRSMCFLAGVDREALLKFLGEDEE